jgi:hypothetical protein
LNRDGELRELIQLRKQWRPIDPFFAGGIGKRLDGKLTQLGRADPGCRRFNTLKAANEFSRSELDGRVCGRRRSKAHFKPGISDSLSARGTHILFCLEETFEEVPVTHLHSGTSPFNIDVTDLHHGGPRRRALLKQARQRVYRPDATRRKSTLIAQEALPHTASAKIFILAKLGDVRTATGAELVDCVGITHRLSDRRLRKMCCGYNRGGKK